MNITQKWRQAYGIVLLLWLWGITMAIGQSPYSNRFYDVNLYIEGSVLPTKFASIATDDISTTGTVLNVAGDRTADIPLGNFNFSFYCKTVTSLRVGEDGAILVNQPGANLPNDNTGYLRSLNAAIVPYWDKFQILPDSGGRVSYEFRGTAPNRRLIVEWKRISPMMSKFFHATFRAVLYEGTSDIAFYYPDICFTDECDFTAINRHPDCDNLQTEADLNDFAQMGSVGLKSDCRAGTGANTGVNKDPLNNRIIDNPGSSVTLKDLETDKPFIAITFTFKQDGCPGVIAPVNKTVCQSNVPFVLDSISPVKFGSWSGSGLPFLTLNPTNPPRSLFRPTTPGTYQLNFDPGCPDFAYTINITVLAQPSAFINKSGKNEPVKVDTIRQCKNPVFQISAVTPTVGTGRWERVSGTGTIANPNTPNTVFTFNTIQDRTEVLLWIVQNGQCRDTARLVVINNFLQDIALMSPDKIEQCDDDEFVVRAVRPAIGTFVWSIVSGPGRLSTPNLETTNVTGVTAGSTTVVKFEVMNGVCKDSAKVTLINYQPVVATLISPKKIEQCNKTEFIVEAATPSVGTGMWMLVGGSQGFINGTNPATVTGIPASSSSFLKWVVTNGTCIDADTLELVNKSPLVPVINSPNPFNKCGGNDNIVGGPFVIEAQLPPAGVTGTWTLVSKNNVPGEVILENANTNIVTVKGVLPKDDNTSFGEAMVRWTISDNVCSAFMDIVLRRFTDVEAAFVTPNPYAVCEQTEIVVTAVQPRVGTGAWTKVSGNGTITAANPATITGLPFGETFVAKWKVDNGLCTSQRDLTVRNDLKIIANANVDATNCNNGGFTMSANSAPAGATGEWSVVSGSANILQPTNPSTIVSDVPVGTSAVLRWTIKNGVCESFDDVVLTNNAPVTAVINTNILLENCNANTFTMNASSIPSDATGVWSVKPGTGTAVITNPNNPQTTVEVAAGRTVVLIWTVTKGGCTDAKEITLRNYAQEVAFAGEDKRMCNMTSFTLSGNTPPQFGTGTWSVVAGSASVARPNDPSSPVSIPVGQSATLRWTIQYGPCSVSDDVVLVNDAPVIATIAPVPQNCENGTFAVSGNIPALGTGRWSVVIGGGSIVDPNSPITQVIDVPVRSSTLVRWTLTNGSCSDFKDVLLVNNKKAVVKFQKDTAKNCRSNLMVNLTELGSEIIDADGVWSFSDNSIAHGNFIDINGNVTNVWSRAVAYQTSAAERAVGEVRLRLCSENVGTCPIECKDILVILPTPRLPCIEPFTVTVEVKPPTCTAVFNINTLLSSDTYKYYTVSVFDPDGNIIVVGSNGNIPILKEYIGKKLKVVLKDACDNMCMGFINVVDLTPPTIKCPPDLVLDCSDLGNLLSPTVAMSGDLNIDNIKSVDLLFYSKGARDGSTEDCSEVREQIVEDYIYDRTCFEPFTNFTIPSVNRLISDFSVSTADANAIVAAIRTVINQQSIVKIVVRRFIGIDIFGNRSLPCYQIIYIKQGPIGDINKVVCPPTNKINNYTCSGVDEDCMLTSDPSKDPNAVPFIDANDNGIFDAGDIPLFPDNPQFCNLRVTFKDDTTKTCGNSAFDLRRTYTVEDKCTGKIVTCDPIMIKVKDTHPPIVIAEYKTYVQSQTKQCYIDLWGLQKEETLNENWLQKEERREFDGYYKTCKDGITKEPTTDIIYAAPSSTFCGGTVSIKLTACDPLCTNDTVVITVNNSAIKGRFIRSFFDSKGIKSYEWVFEGMFTELGDYPLVFRAVDKCGNATALKKFIIRVSDIGKPAQACIEFLSATIGTTGTVRVEAAKFLNGSYSSLDNCGIDRIVVKRLDGKKCSTTACAVKENDTDCFRDYVEFGCCDVDDTVRVIVRVIDQLGNYNDCMVNVIVTDKSKPTCVAPSAVETLCLDVENNKISINQKLQDADKWFGRLAYFDNCGTPSVEYSVVKNLNNCQTGTITRNWTVKECKGNGTATCSQVITVKSVHDFTVDFPDDVELECYAALPDIEDLKKQMLDPLSWGKGLDGAIKNDGCGVIVVAINDEKVSAGDACAKILRKIKVIDWCRYSPNNDQTDANVNPFGLPECGDNHSNPAWKTKNLEAWQTLDRSHLTGSGCRTPLQDLNRERRFRDADNLILTAEGLPLGPPNIGNSTHPHSYSDGIIVFTQIIKIIDKNPPIPVRKSNETVCTTTCSEGSYTTTLEANETCNGVSSTEGVAFTWTIVKNNVSGKGAGEEAVFTGKTATINVKLDTGTYAVKWTARDRCGNESALQSYTLTVFDCTKPVISVLNKNIELGGIGSVSVNIDHILNTLTDNCTEYAFLYDNIAMIRDNENPNNTYPVGTNRKSITVTCADVLAPVKIQVWTRDRKGNTAVTYATLTVIDNAQTCFDTEQVVKATGKLLTINGKPVHNASIEAMSPNTQLASSSATSKIDGSFNINLFTGKDYDIYAKKADELYAGVTTFDLAQISGHLLGSKKIESPYSLIAADVDKSGEVDGADMLYLRQFILRRIPALPAGAWRFIDKNYVFKNAENPFAEDFPERILLKKEEQIANRINFQAVKVGDVNASFGSFTNTLERNNRAVNLLIKDTALLAGRDYNLDITADNFNLTSVQFTLGFNHKTAKINGITGGQIGDISDKNFGVFENDMTFSWNTSNATPSVIRPDFYNKKLFSIHFTAHNNTFLSDILKIHSDITPIEGIDKTGSPVEIRLQFDKDKTISKKFALYQNRPNPFKNETRISFDLPENGVAALIFYNATGQVLKTVRQEFKAGYNEVSVSGNDFLTKGVVFYRLESGGYSAVGRMVVLN